MASKRKQNVTDYGDRDDKPEPIDRHAFSVFGFSMNDTIFPMMETVLIRANDHQKPSKGVLARKLLETTLKARVGKLIRPATKPKTRDEDTIPKPLNGTKVYVVVGFTTVGPILLRSRPSNGLNKQRNKSKYKETFGTKRIARDEGEQYGTTNKEKTPLLVVYAYNPLRATYQYNRKQEYTPYVLLQTNPRLATPYAITRDVAFFRAPFRLTNGNNPARVKNFDVNISNKIRVMQGGTEDDELLRGGLDAPKQQNLSEEHKSSSIPRSATNSDNTTHTPPAMTPRQLDVDFPRILRQQETIDLTESVAEVSQEQDPVSEKFLDAEIDAWSDIDSTALLQHIKSLWLKQYPALKKLDNRIVSCAKSVINEVASRLVRLGGDVIPAFLIHCLRYPDPSWTDVRSTTTLSLCALHQLEDANAFTRRHRKHHIGSAMTVMRAQTTE